MPRALTDFAEDDFINDIRLDPGPLYSFFHNFSCQRVCRNGFQGTAVFSDCGADSTYNITVSI